MVFCMGWGRQLPGNLHQTNQTNFNHKYATGGEALVE